MSPEQARDAGQAPAAPLLSVVRGQATPAELAAVLVVLLGIRNADNLSPAVPAAPQSQWAERFRGQSGLPRPGPGAWRASALPR
jgi:Acyl-CoA carboxylase epsilon subunit